MISKIKKSGFNTQDFGSAIVIKPARIKVDNERVTFISTEEGGSFIEPIDKIKVSDIISSKICRSPKGDICWYVNVFKHIRNPFFCHAFKTESGKRYDVINNAGIFV